MVVLGTTDCRDLQSHATESERVWLSENPRLRHPYRRNKGDELSFEIIRFGDRTRLTVDRKALRLTIRIGQ